MGAIYVWRSPEAALDCYRSIGPHKIVHSGSSPQYLLDGVQRLTTLLGALSPLDEIDVDADEFVEADGEPPTENYAVHYDFETGDFVREQDFRKNSSKPTLPMGIALGRSLLVEHDLEAGFLEAAGAPVKSRARYWLVTTPANAATEGYQALRGWLQTEVSEMRKQQAALFKLP